MICGPLQNPAESKMRLIIDQMASAFRKTRWPASSHDAFPKPTVALDVARHASAHFFMILMDLRTSWLYFSWILDGSSYRFFHNVLAVRRQALNTMQEYLQRTSKNYVTTNAGLETLNECNLRSDGSFHKPRAIKPEVGRSIRCSSTAFQTKWLEINTFAFQGIPAV